MEKRELEELPQRIEALELKQGEYHERMADPTFYQQDGADIAKAKAELDAIERELAETYLRWETLESLR